MTRQISPMHHLYAALRANNLYHRDQHYVVQQGEIVIVDEFTGRLMTGRRWSDGLHQAVEAKEGVAIQAENQTLASITFQNYFRLYAKLAGMTGTATLKPMSFRRFMALRPSSFRQTASVAAKINSTEYTKPHARMSRAAIKDIRECYERGQPVLVGTTSIENSEVISELLNKEKLPTKC